MKTKFILLFFNLIVSFITLGQDSIQTGYVKYIYKTQESPNSESTNHFALLNFNSFESLFVTDRFGMNEKSNLSTIKSDANNVGYLAPTSSEKGNMIYRNFEKKEIIYNVMKIAVFEPFVVVDNWVEMDWKLTTEKKLISNYECTKATTVFRGTEFTVWFTDEIPFPYGPLKLFGLSGVILETSYLANNKEFKYTAIEICYPCKNNQTIEKPIENIVKTIEEEVFFRDNFSYFFINEANSKLEDIGVLYLDEIPSEKKITKKRNLRLEKKYEWETKKTKRLKQGINYMKLLHPNKKKENSKPVNDLYFRPEKINTQRF